MDLINKKRVLFVVAHKDFRDEEYFITREIMESTGVVVVTASSDPLPAIGVKGGETKVDVVFPDVRPEEYDAIVVAGGRGIKLYLDDPVLNDLIRDFNTKGKVVAAICAAPTLFAKAGILRGRKATAWKTEDNMEYPDILRESGAEFVDHDVVVDGRIVTANAPEASKKFGETVARMITDEGRP